MSYAQFNLIEASDYNGLVGGNPTTTSGTLNAVWATGGGQTGYGQTAVGNVAIGQTVAATNWASLINSVNSANSHQGAAATSLSAPVAGGVITYLSGLPTALTNIYTNRGNAVAQGSTSTTSVSNASAWSDYANFAFTVSFANGDAARYFFNAGGQLRLTCSHSNTDAGINAAMNSLCTAVGNIFVSGQNSGSRSIAGSSFNGITKTGGSGSTETLATNAGYFGLNTANTLILDQNSGTAPYTTTVQVLMYARTSAANVSGNGDNGSSVFVNVVLDKISGNGVLGANSTAVLTVFPPSTGNIANTWGTITVSGSSTVV